MADTTVRTEPRYVYRLPPCPAYDIEGTESWLTDLAAKGYMLTQDGFFCGLGIFEKSEPQAVRYRLEATPHPTKPLDEPDTPSDEALELSESLGWRYITRRGDFYIYASAEPGARELNTDPAVQALALAAVTRRCRTSVIDIIVELLLWCFIFPFVRADGRFLIPMISIGTALTLWGTALVAWFVVSSARRAISLRRLQKKLAAGGSIDHNRDWQSKAWRHHLVRASKLVLTVAWVIVMLINLAHGLDGSYETPLEQIETAPPFATLADLVDAPTDYKSAPIGGYGNTARIWSDLLAPVNYAWDEIAVVTAANGYILDASLYIDYHEAANEAIARMLAEEYHRAARWSNRDGYAPLSVNLPDVDFAVAFRDEIHIPTIVLQKGNRVLCVALHQFTSQNSEPIPLEHWAARVADALK